MYPGLTIFALLYMSSASAALKAARQNGLGDGLGRSTIEGILREGTQMRPSTEGLLRSASLET